MANRCLCAQRLLKLLIEVEGMAHGQGGFVSLLRAKAKLPSFRETIIILCSGCNDLVILDTIHQWSLSFERDRLQHEFPVCLRILEARVGNIIIGRSNWSQRPRPAFS